MLEYKKNIKLLYVVYFFSSMVFHRGIFILYLLDCGINNKEIGWLQLAFFWSNFLFEIPTGIIGDKIGRKWSLVIAFALLVINAIGMIAFKQFSFFFLLFVLEGVAFAFRSGANSALLYDSLKLIGKKDEYVKHISRISTLSSVVLGVSMVIGGYLKKTSWDYVYLAYALSVFISTIACLKIHERVADFSNDTDHSSSANEDVKIFKALYNSLLKAIVDFIKAPEGYLFVCFVFAYGIYNLAMTPAFVQGQALFKFFGSTPDRIALIFGVIQVCSGAMYFLSEKISKMISFKYLIAITLVLSSACLAIHGIENYYLSMISFFIVGVFPSATDILIDGYIQEKIPSHIRASLLSTKSFVESFLVGIGYFAFGYLIDKSGVTRAYLVMSIMPIISLALFEYYFYKRNKS